MSQFETQTYDCGPLSALRLIPVENKLECSLYRSLVYYSSQGHLKKYEHTLENEVRAVLMGRHQSSTHTFDVSEVFIEYPTFTAKYKGDTIKVYNTPYLAEAQGMSYFCKVYVTITKKKIGGDDSIAQTYRKCLGNIPCMVGSYKCLTSNNPKGISKDQWKLNLGEGIPGGYFIKNGSKIAILSTIKNSTNEPFTTILKKKIVVTRITETHNSKTTIMRLKEGKRKATVKVLPPHIDGGKHLPLYVILYVLTYYQKRKGKFKIDKFDKLILDYCSAKEAPLVEAYLKISKDKFSRFIDKEGKVKVDEVFDYIRHKRDDHKDGRKKKKDDEEETHGYEKDSICQTIAEEITPSTTSIQQKIANLCMIVSHHIRVCAKTRKPDNQDFGSKKKIDDASRMIILHANSAIKSRIINTESDKGRWTIGKMDNENFIETLKVDSYTLISSMYAKYNVDVDERNKSFQLRKVQATCWGGQCPINTSEGKKCGMTGNMSICTRISWNSEYTPGILTPIYDLKDKDRYVVFKKTNDYYKLNYNGKPMFFELNSKDASNSQAYCSETFANILKRYIKEKNLEGITVTIDTSIVTISTVEDKEYSLTCYNGYTFALNCSREVSRVLNYHFKLVNEYCSTIKTKDNNYCFTYNSCVLILEDTNDTIPTVLWFEPMKTMTKIRNCIRSKVLPIDTSVYINEVDNEIKFFYDAGRMMYPMLIADDEGNLNLYKDDYLKKNWSETVDDYQKIDDKIEYMFSHGIMEYVDLKATGSTFQPRSINEFNRFWKLRELLKVIDLRQCSSSLYQIDNDFLKIEDINSVKVKGHTYQVKFGYTKQDEDQLSQKVIIDGVETTVYGYYSVPTTKYVPTKDNFTIVGRVKGTTIRDNYDLFYFENDRIKWIKEKVTMEQTTYKGFKIMGINFKGKEEINVIISEINGEVSITNSNAVLIQYNPKNYFIGNKWYDTGILEDGRVCNYIEFEKEGSSFEFFDTQSGEYTMPLMKDMNYKFFDYETEKKQFDKLVQDNPIHDTECDFLMLFRNDQEHLDNIDVSKFGEEGYINSTFEMLREKYEQFRKRSDIYKIFRYMMWKYKFTHAPIDEGIIYSAVATFCIKPNHNQAPRYTYQCQMAKQALSDTDRAHYCSYPTNIKKGNGTQQHMIETVTEEPLGGVTMTTFYTFVVATLTDQSNFEDALTVAESVMIRYSKISTLSFNEVDNSKGTEYFTFPKDQYGNNEINHKSRNLDYKTGLPIIGTINESGDYVIGKSRKIKQNGEIIGCSPVADYGSEAMVSQIRIMCKSDINNPSNEKTVNIKYNRLGSTDYGGKFAPAHAQKTTIGQISKNADVGFSNLVNKGRYVDSGDYDMSFISSYVNEEVLEELSTGKRRILVVPDDYMPITLNGTRVEILMSPFAHPSRMTMGLNYEEMGTKAGLREQKKFDGTAHHKSEIKDFEDILEKYNMDRKGCEFIRDSDGTVFMDPTTGKPLKVYVTPCAFKKLRHDAKDAISCRYRGKRDPVTDQPKKGRTKGGGQRFGEMENDVCKSHNASALMLDRLFWASDCHVVIFCSSCGKVSSDSDILKGVCKICKMTNTLVRMKQTRVFRIVSQFLQALNICIVMKKINNEDKRIVRILED